MAIYNVNKTTGDITETAGRYADSSNVFYGNIASWNNLTTEEKKEYDHASITDSIDGGVTFPANKVVMTGGENVEDTIDELSSRASVNTFGPSIRLTVNTPITAPSDGYVWYGCGATSGNYCYLYINDVDMGHAVSASNLAALPCSGVFVKKGMTIKFEGVNATAIFYPLEG